MRAIKHISLIIILGFSFLRGEAQVYNFSTVADNKATSVKDQANSGTCWCYATLSFLESELLRTGKGEFDLAEMYVVRYNYIERMKDNYYKGGKGNVDQGSVCHMAINVIDKYGIVPQSVYNGINYASEGNDHTELSAYIKAISAASVSLKNRSEEYFELEKALMDAYLGEVPESFEYEGKTYTPESFAGYLGIDKDDYVEITSFSHHPFYEKVDVEVPDNWDHGKMYNLPLDEFMSVIDRALEKGYTLVWDGDVSEPGYVFSKGIAIIPEDGTMDRKKVMESETVIPEKEITQEIRQKGYENFVTTDDHLEHITGIATDQNGTRYYKVKNSWAADSNMYGGYHYISESYMRAKTISVMLHKDALSKDIKKKLGLD